MVIASRLKFLWPWLVASAAIHGLLLVVWFNLAGSGANDIMQKGIVLELVTIETLSGKATTPPRPTGIKTGNLSAEQPGRTSLSRADAVHAETGAMHVSEKQPAGPTAEVSGPEPAITVAKSGQDGMEKATGSSRAESATNSLVRSHLESFRFYPASARRRGIEGHVDVAFVLTQNGAADQISILQGSGYSMLDRAAIQTVSRAQPFPVDDGRYRFRLRFKRL
ncbi:MAG: energy transducer TonB [Mariprofundaceae bacterium]|nr:energy transducer TonB [Mariprofundaceae bacterium]